MKSITKKFMVTGDFRRGPRWYMVMSSTSIWTSHYCHYKAPVICPEGYLESSTKIFPCNRSLWKIFWWDVQRSRIAPKDLLPHYHKLQTWWPNLWRHHSYGHREATVPLPFPLLLQSADVNSRRLSAEVPIDLLRCTKQCILIHFKGIWE